MRHCLRRAALRVGIGPEAGGGLYKGIKQQPAEGVFFKEKFRMPLHRLYEASVRHIHGFGEAVRRYCHGRKLPGKAAYTLMVAAVYLKNGLSGEPGKRGAAGKAYAVGGAVIGRQHFVRRSRKLGWEILPQSAPEKDIHKLKAAAYAEKGLILHQGKLKQQTVLSVAQGAGFRAGARLLPVEKRRDILSAGD